MKFQSIAIVGGAGFVGSNLACGLRQRFPQTRVIVLDSLLRRGSELNVRRLQEMDAIFVKGDTRSVADLDRLPEFDLLIDCAAEPSVQAGVQGSPRDVLECNLLGTINCLEAARKFSAAFLFLSTSRVFPIARVNGLPFVESATRFEWTQPTGVDGATAEGISEQFSLAGPRSFYGASKLASEQLLLEYAFQKGMPAITNRCGVIAGPWQMGRVDQGVVGLWVAHHHYARPLRYIGFGGTGKQVRDVLHIADLLDLVCLQLQSLDKWDGRQYNVGGGMANAISLAELTALCGEVTGSRVAITPVPETSPVDVRIYATDISQVERDFAWRPQRSVAAVVEDVDAWIRGRSAQLEPILG